MKIGLVGLGKLGLPVALAIEAKGHQVKGFDLNPQVGSYVENKEIPFQEVEVPELLADSKLELLESVNEVVRWAEIIFVAIQTPHEPEYEGITRLPRTRADFSYDHLKAGVAEIARCAFEQSKLTTVVVISTCLPGTYREQIKPLLNEYVQYIYNPFFIAMGTVVPDFYAPEFVLLGTESGREDSTFLRLSNFYASIHYRPLFLTDITTAELIKVLYNTEITAKTVRANAYGELAEKVGADFGDVFSALSLATDRIISTKYLHAGMADGGGCHPRDNIALSWLADKVGMSHNIWEDLMAARQDHTDWLAKVIMRNHQASKLPITLLGKSFKPETNIQTGSAAILLANLLRERGVEFRHLEDLPTALGTGLFFIATRHECYAEIKFAPGSIVIDPFGYISDQDNVEVICLGRQPQAQYATLETNKETL